MKKKNFSLYGVFPVGKEEKPCTQYGKNPVDFVVFTFSNLPERANGVYQKLFETVTPSKSMAHKIARFGWLPDLPDQRDLHYAAPRPLLRKLPTKVDLKEKCPPVYDQGHLGSCTANAIAAAFQFEAKKQRTRDFFPSRLFIYYNERVITNSVESDSGATMRDGIKTVHKKGVCPENMWPYKIERFADKPLQSCFTEALRHQVTSYHRVVRNLNQMKACLAEGYPFVFGITAYESFESEEVAKTGKLNMPKKGEAQVGGHALMAVGYQESSKRFIVRNSWGPLWGLNGYFTIPYAYLLEENLSDDFWTIRMVEAATDVKKPGENGNGHTNGNGNGNGVIPKFYR